MEIASVRQTELVQFETFLDLSRTDSYHASWLSRVSFQGFFISRGLTDRKERILLLLTWDDVESFCKTIEHSLPIASGNHLTGLLVLAVYLKSLEFDTREIVLCRIFRFFGRSCCQ
ncbi:hypothetical protein AB1N83_011492 [Pleurotus pulmonarius]